MTTAVLARGANITLDETVVQARIAWRAGAGVDACALLVGAGGKVRGDADFVFYNQPRDTSGAVELSTDGPGTASVAVNLARVPADVAGVVIAGSMESGTFDTVPELKVTVTSRHGRVLATFPVRDVEPVTAVVFGEFYRRQGRWKFRAIGQGWDSGLAGLATNYGVTVDDEPAAAPAAPPAAPAAPPPAARPARSAPRPSRPSARPAATPAARPAVTPARSVATPAATPARPAATPARPAATPARPAATPARPAATAPAAPAAAPPATTPAARPEPVPQARPDWYATPDNPAVLRWWTGAEWSVQTAPLVRGTPAVCGRCGGPKYRTSAGAPSTCSRCEPEISGVLAQWRTKAARVLAATGTSGPAWDELWSELRYYRVPEEAGREALRPAALHHLHQLLTFAFADGIIEQHEMDGFDDAVRQLGVIDPSVSEMRRRLRRGLQLGLITNGDVPRVAHGTLHLDADEILHLEVPAVRVRQLASGPRHTSGRLIATNAKLRFVGDSAGSDLAWAKVLEIRQEYGTVVVAATTARGGGSYEVGDPEYVAAVLTGVLKIAKRIVAAPGQRDSRAVPPAVRAEVWRRDGGACVECQATEYLEFDHVIPWSRGGATSAGNLQLLCRRCNLAKGARI